MSVIIRLQNLPWSANALDIRQFFKGLSIPEGGVHIVGGEMGDAFIAFSTDEDARQAMMKDRGKLNEVQVRLLLSSRAEMQKVIETARQQSLLALQKAGAIPATATVAPLKTTLSTPQPPVITTNSLQNILGTQLGAAPSFQTYQQQAGITLIPTPTAKTDSSEAKISSRRESNESSTRDRRRSSSRDRRRSRSRDRNDRSSGRRRRERSRSRERERDRKSGRQRSSRRSRSREHSRDRARNGSRSNRNSRDCDTNSNNNRFNRENTQRSSVKNTEVKDSVGNGVKAPAMPSWNMPPTNAYETSAGQNAHNVFNAQVQRNIPLNAFATAPDSGMRPNISNAYTTSPSINEIVSQTPSSKPNSSIAAAVPNFKNFSTTTSTTNNYSINFLSNPTSTSNLDAIKPAFALQNPYTAALRAASSNSNSQDSNSSSLFSPNVQQASSVYPGMLLDKKPIAPQQQTVPPVIAAASPLNTFAQQSPQQQTGTQQQQQPLVQPPIAFANTNPYAQMYPNLFAQAAAAGTGIANPVRGISQNQNSKVQDQKFPQRTAGSNDYKGFQRNNNDDENDNNRSCSIKISNMCNGTTYSDLRKFFSGLFIPHNGIKMINDRDGIRTGVAYIQFSRSSCVGKAMIRNNTFLKTKRVLLEPVANEEFQETEDSYKPHRDRDNYNRFNRNDAYDSGNRGGYDNRTDNRNSPSQGRDDMNSFEGNAMNQHFASGTIQEPLTVLYIEDIPAMASELDIMKMFSVFTIFDILLTVSPENRREFTAYVKFSREEEAKAALMEQSRHTIGHRKVRVRPAKAEEMEKAKEKLRLANEQLKKEEAAMSEAAEKDACKIEATEDFDNIDDDADNINDNDRDDDDDDNDDLTIAGNEQMDHDPNDRGDNNSNDRSDIPNNFDVQASEEYKTFTDAPSDPRLRRQRPSRFAESNNNESTPPQGNDNNDNSSSSQNMAQQPFNEPNFNPSFNAPLFPPMNNIDKNFIILKNCDYTTRINNVAQLMLSANLDLKHIEPLRNERQMPSGEFIVEFTNPKDATMALNRFNNTTFRNRNLRVRSIMPQEIADRIGKPFMNYFPGGGRGGQMPMRGNFDLSLRGPPPPNFRMNGDFMDGIDRPRFDDMTNNMNNRNRGGGGADDSGGKNFSQMMRGGVGGGGGNVGGGGRGERPNFNNQDMFMDDDDVNRDVVDCDNDTMDKSENENEDEVVSVSSNGPTICEDSASIPEKFSRLGCVLAMENVPFKADLKDIIEFFSDFDVCPDDIIRRFNDDGSPTGDARVAFPTPAEARAAFEAKRQHTIFNRTIYINIL